MANKKNNQEKIPGKYLPTKFMLTARVLVGGYLVYISYSLIDGVVNGEGRDRYFFGAFIIAFAIIGILLVAFAGRDLLRGKYVGGELDAGEADAEENTAEPAKSEALTSDEPAEKEDKKE